MGIFSSIKDAIFGHHDAAPAPAAPSPAADAAPEGGTVAAAPAPAAAPAEPVDVEAVLDQKLADSGQDLDWRSSIVDLMKLVGIEPSLEHRRELAGELHYDGDTDDTATMNIWLHQKVMEELAANGGKVPANLTA